MTLLSRLRQVSFLVIMAVAVLPAPVVSGFDDPICPARYCDYCPADWYGSCYVDPSDSCGEYGCGGSYGQCVVEGTEDRKEVCMCEPCIEG